MISETHAMCVCTYVCAIQQNAGQTVTVSNCILFAFTFNTVSQYFWKLSCTFW